MSNSSISFQMQGLPALTANLTALAGTAQGTPIRAGMRKMGKVIQAKIIAAAPVDDKTPDGVHIKDNVVVGRSRSKSTFGREVFTVGIKYGKSKYKDNARNRRLGRVGKSFKTEGETFYWKFIEFGTSHQDKKPFIRPAAEAAAKAALDAFEMEMEASIKRALRRQGTIT